jgi:hypothetical protein
MMRHSRAKRCKMPKGSGFCEYDNFTDTDYCRNCTANIKAWSRRELSDYERRVSNLAYYSARMTHVIPKPAKEKRRANRNKSERSNKGSGDSPSEATGS